MLRERHKPNAIARCTSPIWQALLLLIFVGVHCFELEVTFCTLLRILTVAFPNPSRILRKYLVDIPVALLATFRP